MGSGVAWQRLLSGGASMVPGGGICSLLPMAQPGSVQKEEQTPLSVLAEWHPFRAPCLVWGNGHLESCGNRALPDPVPRLQPDT